MKYILVTGGVISGVGKGVIASSTGVLLKSYGLRVTSIKIDPYLNIDAGTLTPFDHGEVFVLDDGGEVDLDLGNYERFLNVTLSKEHNITTGKIYQSVIEKERRGDYLGKTVQVVPHITDAIQNWILRVAKLPVDSSNLEPEVCIIELGGTVGDIESAPFIEAMRQFQFRVGSDNFFLIHVSLVPFVGEQKTKPTQSSVRDLRGLGLSPDVIACRSANPLEKSTCDKIAMFCHVAQQNIFAIHDCSSVYHVPLLLEKQGLLKVLQAKLNLPSNLISSTYLAEWKAIVNHYDNMVDVVKIAIVGKYTALHDSYLSITKALQHASVFCDRKLEIIWIEADLLEPAAIPEENKNAWKLLKSATGILIPGGFGERGVLGKILACQYSRENKVPLLGICLGLQVAVIEFSRNVLGWKDANSEEFNAATNYPVVVFMPEISKTHMGGTMRLGLRTTKFVHYNSKSQKLYGGKETVQERHRHRYEVNIKFVKQLEEKGLIFVGQDELGERMEILELKDHPFYVAVQYHPEFTSRPVKPSPLFSGFIMASIGLGRDI